MRRVLLKWLWLLVRPLLFLLNAEQAHRLAIGMLAATPRLHGFLIRLIGGPPTTTGPIQVGPLVLGGPVGLAAGLDKDGEAVLFWPHLGFGFIELGTVTAKAQPGNPPPRVFRLVPERGLINRMGFNNHGAEVLAERLRSLRESGRWPTVPVGANIGKSKVTPLDEVIEDYLHSVACLQPWVDYFTVNVSSPNTPGLQTLQQAEPLRALLSAVVPAANGLPVFVKFSPDLPEDNLADAVEVAIEVGCTGIIATNTTRSRPDTTGRLGEDGGMSGAPLWPLARTYIGRLLEAANGRIPVIGAGGIHSAEQVAELLDAGCVAVQIYSCMIFEGPGLPNRINDGLVRRVASP